MTGPVHGRLSTYTNRRCRCDPCTDAARDYKWADNRRRFERTAANGGIAPVAKHNQSTYVNWGCRCETCTADNTRVVAEYRARKAGCAMTERAMMLRHIRQVVAELDACRLNAQPGGKYGAPLTLVRYPEPTGSVPSTVEQARPWGTCSACGTRQPLRGDGNILGHGPYGARCTGSYRLPADPDGAA